jgi:hypothetical protein
MMAAPRIAAGFAALRAMFRRLTLVERLEQRVDEARLEVIMAEADFSAARGQLSDARAKLRVTMEDLSIARARDTVKQ